MNSLNTIPNCFHPFVLKLVLSCRFLNPLELQEIPSNLPSGFLFSDISSCYDELSIGSNGNGELNEDRSGGEPQPNYVVIDFVDTHLLSRILQRMALVDQQDTNALINGNQDSNNDVGNSLFLICKRDLVPLKLRLKQFLLSEFQCSGSHLK